MGRVRKIIFDSLYSLGIAHFLFFLNKKYERVPIILFHRVSPNPSPCWPPLTPTEFEKTIDLLSKHYTFYSLDEILDNEINKKKNACCVVFDDGYYDFKEFALPVLIKYNIPTTLFVPTFNIENNSPLWTSIIDQIVMNIPITNHDMIIDVSESACLLKLKTNQELFVTANSIKQVLIKLSTEERNEFIKRFHNQFCKDKEFKHDPMLSWEDIITIVKSTNGLINIQTHTHTHPYLPSLRYNELIDELNIPYTELRKKNLNIIDKVAYPIGGFSPNVLDEVSKIYKYGFAVENKHFSLNQLKNNKNYHFQIPRYNIHTTNPKETFLFVNGFHSRLIWLKNKIKRSTR